MVKNLGKPVFTQKSSLIQNINQVKKKDFSSK